MLYFRDFYFILLLRVIIHIILNNQVSKLGKLKCKDSDSSVQDVKADDLRQMFLAMTEEVYKHPSLLPIYLITILSYFFLNLGSCNNC